jgi:hypothetical protein
MGIAYLRLQTHSENVTVVAFPLQQRLHIRASVLHYTYIACLVIQKDGVCLLRATNWIFKAVLIKISVDLFGPTAKAQVTHEVYVALHASHAPPPSPNYFKNFRPNAALLML